MPVDTSAIKDAIDCRDYLTGILGESDQVSYEHSDWCCPFHTGDDRPSFCVWSDHVHCYGCGFHSDIFGFLMEYEGLSFLEAVEKLTGNVPVMPKPRPTKTSEPKRPSISMQVVNQNFAHLKDGLHYYEQRQITDDTSMLKKLGVKTDFPTLYTTTKGEQIWFKARRYALPNIFGTEVRAINYRRDDNDFLKQFTYHPKMQLVMQDLEEKIKHFPEDNDILKYCGGPKYRQETGSVARVFNVEMIAKPTAKGIETITRPFMLIHAEPKEIDTLALMDKGYPVCGIMLEANLLAMLPGLFSHIPLLYIIRDNDEPGRKKAEAVQTALGRGKIISPLEGKDTGETIAAGVVYKWLESNLGLAPILRGA